MRRRLRRWGRRQGGCGRAGAAARGEGGGRRSVADEHADWSRNRDSKWEKAHDAYEASVGRVVQPGGDDELDVVESGECDQRDQHINKDGVGRVAMRVESVQSSRNEARMIDSQRGRSDGRRSKRRKRAKALMLRSSVVQERIAPRAGLAARRWRRRRRVCGGMETCGKPWHAAERHPARERPARRPTAAYPQVVRLRRTEETKKYKQKKVDWRWVEAQARPQTCAAKKPT